ncbi:MAG: hypothetical protein QM765_11060 [Myxococcales bacterium]
MLGVAYLSNDDAFFVRVDLGGTMLGAPIRVNSVVGHAESVDVAFAPETNSWGVVSCGSNNSNDNLTLVEFDGSGVATATAAESLFNTNTTTARVVWTGTRFVVGWSEWDGVVAVGTKTGSGLETATVASDATLDGDLELAHNPRTGKIGVAWVTNTWGLGFQIVDENGAAISARLDQASTNGVRALALATVDDGFLAMWEDLGKVYAWHTTDAGANPRRSAELFGGADDTDRLFLTPWQGKALLASTTSSGSPREIHLRTVDASFALSAPTTLLKAVLPISGRPFADRGPFGSTVGAVTIGGNVDHVVLCP